MALNLTTLLADYNGSAMAIAGHAEWGFIPQDWFLAIPQNSILPANYAIGTDPFGGNLNLNAFLKANYHRVRNAAGSNEAALFVALLRMHIASKGTIANLLANRSVVEDEYIVVAPQNGNWDDAANQIPTVASSRDMAKFVKHHGDTIVHQMVYVFSARGHHWDPEYDPLYNRLKAACFMDTNGGFTLPSNEVLYRLAIHPFGIKALTDLTLADKNAGQMAAAMFIRFNPTSPISGTAQVTTLKATLNSMAQEAWWTAFANKYANEIAAIDAEVVAIQAQPYQYHVAAKVFGFANRTPVSNNANVAFNVLCQLALGYIDHLGRRHTLSGQRAITQKSGGPRGVADAFAKACDRFGKPDTAVADMATFLASL
jgi:hypothetical protein